MATQFELIQQKEALLAQRAELFNQILVAGEQDDPETQAELQSRLSGLEIQIQEVENELSTLTNADPYVFNGESTIPPGPPKTEPEPIPNYQYPLSPYGTTPYDDDGNLQSGWELDEGNNPVWVGFPENKLNTEANQPRSLDGQKNSANQGAANQNIANQTTGKDWRVTLSLAPGAKYLYNATNAGILEPLKGTKGVVFPYTPSIQMSYNASYDNFEPTHSNYKIYQYKNSSVGEITITADFTAQDTLEGAYLLAVIHFFRSVTKMFYGQDGTNGQGVKNGTPPPLCYLTGFGSYQFDNHPLVVSSFSLNYPNEVDYIRVGKPGQTGGQNQQAFKYQVDKWIPGLSRLFGAGLKPGAITADPVFQANTTVDPTYVPTKVQLTITCLPIVTRKNISDNFSLEAYGTGRLLQGSRNGIGGIW